MYINNKILTEPYLETGLYISPGNVATEGLQLKVPENKYFVMGDNRGHSLDSRNFGFIDRSKITGKAWVIYWPLPRLGPVPAVNYSF